MKTYQLFIFSALLSSMLVTGCGSNVAHNSINVSSPKPKLPMPSLLAAYNFGEPQQLVAPEKLFHLSEDQIAAFEQFASQPENIEKPAHKLISDYLRSRLDDYRYYADTLIAEESLIQRQGNCLSLAIVTKALANLRNVELTYQLVETQPVFQKEGDLILSSQHVRTKLLQPLSKEELKSTFLWRGGIVVDYFPEQDSRILRSVSEPEFVGMFYRNKAAEALIQKDLDRAYWLVKQTLQLNPTDPHGLNMMALIHEKKGAPEIAEQIYEFALDTNQDKIDLLSNFHLLLKRTQQFEKADAVALQLNELEDLNPFKWISLANQAYNRRDYKEALTYYRRAKKLAPYLHDVYAGIARTEFQMGDWESAQSEMQKALERSYRNDTKALYQAKIEMLSQLLNQKTADSSNQ